MVSACITSLSERADNNVQHGRNDNDNSASGNDERGINSTRNDREKLYYI